MVYDHAVKAYGKFYPAGVEVPEQNPAVSESEIVEKSETADEAEKPKRSRKTAQEKSE